MPPFLERLARVLLETHPDGLQDVAVVLPGRRAGMVLRKYLAQLAGRSQWSPDMLDMGIFLERVSGMRRGSAMELLFLLYRTHRELRGDRTEGFDEFLQWAPVTLRDMSEVDQHLLDLDDLYRELHSYDEIEAWSFTRLGEPSAAQQRLIQHWKATGELHRAMGVHMRAVAMGTAGAVARAAAESVAGTETQLPWKAVWFAGLNALEPAPTTVIQALQKIGLAHLAWDTDRWYLEDPLQEAGLFLRRSIAAMGPGVLPPVDAIRTRPRTVHIVSVPNTVAQAAHAAQYLHELAPDERAATVVVLADELLLMPLLEALPADIAPLNVTMGLPLEALPIHGFTEAFFDLHRGYREEQGFRLADAERFFGHPFIFREDLTPRLITSLRSGQRSTIPLPVLADTMRDSGFPEVEKLIAALTPVNDPVAEMPARSRSLFAWCDALCGSDLLAREQLFRMARLQQHLDQELQRSGLSGIGMEAYTRLRDRLLREERLDLIGEPLSGLQVMGLLETRAIDHQHILVLGATEGILPRGEGEQSWIPNDIRKSHGLPLRHDREAITAYHAIRLLQGADKVHLVHPSITSPDSTGPSRFMAQWAHELPGGTASKVVHSGRTATIAQRAMPLIAVQKDDAVRVRLDAILTKGLSPSALGTWLRCPLDFYFTYIMGIRAPDEVDGQLGSDILGEAVHAVLEAVFRPLLGQRLAAEVLRKAAGNTHAMLLAHLGGAYPPEVLSRGHFRLRIEMAANAMERYLKAEADRCATGFSIPLGLEIPVHGELPGGTRLRGRCDRVEDRDGLVHILDLKTGTVNPADLRLKTLDREGIGAGQQQAMQLLIYAWAYLMQHPDVTVARAAIIPLRTPSAAEGHFLHVGGSSEIWRDQLPGITTLLHTLVDELRDPAVPFIHDPDSKWCTCCTTP